MARTGAGADDNDDDVSDQCNDDDDDDDDLNFSNVDIHAGGNKGFDDGAIVLFPKTVSYNFLVSRVRNSANKASCLTSNLERKNQPVLKLTVLKQVKCSNLPNHFDGQPRPHPW
jgi:hypothetical protein